VSYYKKADNNLRGQFSSLLFGTGDWHCAYVLLYGPRILEVAENENVKPAVVETTAAPSPMEASSSASPQQ
jgi:hypothetical protein